MNETCSKRHNMRMKEPPSAKTNCTLICQESLKISQMVSTDSSGKRTSHTVSNGHFDRNPILRKGTCISSVKCGSLNVVSGDVVMWL